MNIKRYDFDRAHCTGDSEFGCPSSMEECSCGDYVRWEDLIAAGVLVPVPVGEACERRHCGSDTFLHDADAYFDAGDKYRPKRLSDGKPIMVEWHTIVQPVRLVRLEDVG